MAARAEKKHEQGKPLSEVEIIATALLYPEKFDILVRLDEDYEDDE
jgi:hypothetical protein